MKTIRVRIAVAVGKDGSFNAQGYWDAEGSDDQQKCLNYSRCGVHDCIPARLDDHEFHIVIVEADVPLPESVVVRGEVVDG